MKITSSTPKKDQYFMPAEYHNHAGTFMLWPYRKDVWRNDALPAQKAFIEVASTIAKYEPVILGVPASDLDKAQSLVNHPNIRIEVIESNDAWARDTGPTFIRNHIGDVRAIDWRFNAWGGEYDGLYKDWSLDDQVASILCDKLSVSYYHLDDFVLEGGSIHVDGEGTALVTEACLLSQGRNPHLTKKDIEKRLKNYLNVSKVIWLPHGIYLDETNEHVDNIVCFVKPGTVMIAYPENQEDAQYPLSKASYDVLVKEKDAQGRKFEIIKMVMPKPIYISLEESTGVKLNQGTLVREENLRLAASYINFYICNEAIIMPSFGDDNDIVAKDIVAKAFPHHQVHQIYAKEILLGGGNIHCITQQIPEGVKL